MVCKDCLLRKVGCHSNCEMYLREKAEHDDLCATISRQKKLNMDYNGVHYYTVRKRKSR